ncbi:small guanosine triphosphatase family Ras-related in brain (Rab) family protein (macronuclear) [Tetrahymena thermophila SB210]|uniref:Ras-related protein Rab-1 n=1 Tax=Tetrahymena thermophila (strain SB210) TaxID=312017 RepID=Q24F57_TETTS|nr:small guanosine triphosphatase family Ras-related in brain (Rab) family protein [Tetrahymena thermophila SB210]EAS06418.3 small guanosine triphosphatase family Ras-related in brain (Rab) family protein [Tetrahymena thermophila SB210]|eukprot:XP_001026663.3 small guanosine triphosphatase family Ras-related in brain (Rab) family protein [Tetrahymena thermophila SB210]
MDSGQYDHLFKILLIGNSGVGKTCMLMRYSENQFTYNFYNTIGVDFKIKALRLEDKNIKLQIWDTAGQDRFRTITCSYYRGAHGILIVYDITERESFDNVKTWMVEIEKHAKKGVQKMLIGNKSDCSNRAVSYEEGFELAKQYQIPFAETSAKNASNIDLAFTNLAKNILGSGQVLNTAPSQGMKIQQNKYNTQQSGSRQVQQNQKNQGDDCC